MPNPDVPMRAPVFIVEDRLRKGEKGNARIAFKVRKLPLVELS